MASRARAFLDSLRRRAERALTRVRTLHGLRVEVFNQRADIDDERLFARVDEALGLIASADPRRFRRLARDLRVVHVRRGMTRGAYVHPTRTCILDNTFVANPAFTAAEVAACIVHEAMHARIACMGVRRRVEDLPREERLCRRAEIAFAERVPDGAAAQPVIARASAALELRDDDVAPAIDYAEVRRRVAAADLAALRAPRWYKRWIARRLGVTLPE
jgi:hypothetical protein